MSSIIYSASIFIALIGMCVMKKSQEKINITSEIILSIFMLMCYQTCCAWTMSKVGIPVSIIFVSITNIFLGVACLVAAKKYGSQKYFFEYVDIIALVVIFGIAVGCGVHQFGSKLELFNYQSPVDSARHLQYARKILVSNEITVDKPFMAINAGLVFEALDVFFDSSKDYRWILFVDVYMLFMSGMMFWVLIRSLLHDKGLIIAGIIASVYYMAGYPLNNMVFGTSYLGAGVTVCILIFTLVERYINGKLLFGYFLFGMLISFMALLKAYNLFFPIVLIGVIIYFALKFWEKRIKGDSHIIMYVLYLLCIGCFISLCVIFKLLPMDSTVVQALGAEGYMYNSLFGDYIFLIPFILYRLYKCTYKNKISFDYTMCLFLIAFIIGLLYANYIGKVSTYYYFKTYYLFWMISFYILVLDIAECEKEKRDIWYVYGSSIIILFIFLYSGIEAHLEKHSTENGKNLNWELQANSVFRIYTWNYEMGSVDNMYIPNEKVEIYQKVAELSGTPENVVQYLGPYEFDNYGFYAIARQWEEETFFWGDTQSFIDNARNKSSYILQIYDDRVYAQQDLFDYIDTLNIVYQNNVGRIVEVDR